MVLAGREQMEGLSGHRQLFPLPRKVFSEIWDPIREHIWNPELALELMSWSLAANV